MKKIGYTLWILIVVAMWTIPLLVVHPKAQAPAAPPEKVTDHQAPRHAWVLWTDLIGTQQRVSLVRADNRCYLWFEVSGSPSSSMTAAGVAILPRECPPAEKMEARTDAVTSGTLAASTVLHYDSSSGLVSTTAGFQAYAGTAGR